MEKLSTQTDFEILSLEESAKAEKACFEIQNRGAEDKQRAGRRAGILLNEIEDKHGPKAKKNLLTSLETSAAIAKKWQKDAEVPNSDYERYVEETRKRAKEFTNSGLRRAGKEKASPRVLSVTSRILKKLTPWVDSTLLRDAGRKKYSGPNEELLQVANLLEKLSVQFFDCAKKIREGLDKQ